MKTDTSIKCEVPNMSVQDYVKALLISILNIIIGSLCISIYRMGVVGVAYSAILSVFGMMFLPISFALVLLGRLVHTTLIKNKFKFILSSLLITLPVAYLYYIQGNRLGVSQGFSYGAGIGFIITGLMCNSLIAYWIRHKDKNVS